MLFRIDYNDDKEHDIYVDLRLQSNPEKIQRRYELETAGHRGDTLLFRVWRIDGHSNEETEISDALLTKEKGVLFILDDIGKFIVAYSE